MIAKYKSTPWIISAAVALLLIAILGLTFTRAAERPAPPVAVSEERPKPTDVIEKEFARQQELVRKLQGLADELQANLNRQAMDAIVSPGPSEVVTKMELQRLEAQAERNRLAALYKYLSQQSRGDLKRSISTASPDRQLTDLMQQHDTTEQKLADTLENVAPEHVDVKRITAVLKQIQKQIEDRIDGIMSGLKARLAAEEAHLEALEKTLQISRQHYLENLQQSRPYQQILQELRAQEEILQKLRMRMAEERIDRALEESKRK